MNTIYFFGNSIKKNILPMFTFIEKKYIKKSKINRTSSLFDILFLILLVYVLLHYEMMLLLLLLLYSCSYDVKIMI